MDITSAGRDVIDILTAMSDVSRAQNQRISTTFSKEKRKR